MTAKRLRAVGAQETAPKRAPRSVVEAVEWGSQRDLLVMLRKRVAQAVEDPNIRGADLAALSRRLMEVTKELTVLDAVPFPTIEREVADGRFDPSQI